MSHQATNALPWWIVVGRNPRNGEELHRRISAPSSELAQIQFERDFSGYAVVSVAWETYRNELVA